MRMHRLRFASTRLIVLCLLITIFMIQSRVQVKSISNLRGPDEIANYIKQNLCISCETIN
jgi:hypothetical protein